MPYTLGERIYGVVDHSQPTVGDASEVDMSTVGKGTVVLGGVLIAIGLWWALSLMKKGESLGDYCTEFYRPDQFTPSEGVWTRGRCYGDKAGAEGQARNMKTSGWTTRVVET